MPFHLVKPLHNLAWVLYSGVKRLRFAAAGKRQVLAEGHLGRGVGDFVQGLAVLDWSHLVFQTPVWNQRDSSCLHNAALVSMPRLIRSYQVSFSIGLIFKKRRIGEHEGVSYTSAKWHYLYLFWDLLTIRTKWNRNLKFLEKVFISYWVFLLLQAPFLPFLCLPLSRGDFHQQLQGEHTEQCKLHRNASSTLLQDLANWKIILNCYSKIWMKRWQITASLKWDPSWEKRRSSIFFSIENECFRGNWHFPEESLGNWIWDLYIST